MAGAEMTVALALTWDGARWPVRTLPLTARAFLDAKPQAAPIPSSLTISQLFAADQIREIRICWVPRLKGGDDVLSDSFQIPGGKRMGFHPVKTIRFDDILGVIYRRR
jgi:hypothetical protein